MNNIAKLIAVARQQAKLSQAAVAQAFTDRGAPISPQSISAWEKERAYPNAEQFLILCDILKIADIRDTFQRTEIPTIFDGLNEEGKQKLYEHAELLRRSGLYAPIVPSVPDHIQITETGIPNIVPFAPAAARRTMKIYHLAVSAGTGQFLDSDSYDELEVGDEVPMSADFGVCISGDSMEPQFVDGQTVWVHSQPTIQEGDIGIFMYDGDAYIKKLGFANGRTMLISLNKAYSPILVDTSSAFKVFGRVVG